MAQPLLVAQTKARNRKPKNEGHRSHSSCRLLKCMGTNCVLSRVCRHITSLTSIFNELKIYEM